MGKKLTLVSLAILAAMLTAAPYGSIKREKIGPKMQIRNDVAEKSVSKVGFSGLQGSTFDKSGNGYGWYNGYNRKVQVNHDPVTGTMVGSLYRRLNPATGSGTIGGMTGEWGSAFSGYAQMVYSESQYQASGTLPGGRFPHSSEFINGYFFGLFNDYDTITGKTDGTISQPMFTVADATFGWDLAMWSAPKRIEATEGGAVIPGAWTAVGDVVFNPEDGYYYWTSSWAMGGLVASWEEMKTPFVCGRSNEPANPDSWEWTDYNELLMDCSNGANDFMYNYADFQIAYAKDIYGNGTGYGIIVTPFVDDTYVVTNAAGDTLDVTSHERLGYMYTTNWGADWSTGDFKANWVTPGNLGNNLIPADEVFKLFDWYGTVVTDTLSIDSLGNAIVESVPMNWPNILANIDVVCTENNEVHVLTKVIGGSTEAPDYWFYANEEKTIAGYYDIVGQITETGVVWKSANYIATWMGMFDTADTVEMLYSNWNRLSIGYAGNGVIYATWWDRPETRYVTVQTANPAITEPRSVYVVDGFFAYSPDNGNTWVIDKTVPVPDSPYVSKYAFNVTKTANLMEEGWTVATHGTNVTTPGATNDGVMTVYAACQYYDNANPIEDPIKSWMSYQQFLKLWKITGTATGVETEVVSMIKDFNLYQNYPNPFNPSTEIRFALQNAGKVKLSVYNSKGQLVANLKNEKMAKGVHSVNFDATSLNSGVYFYKLDVNGMSESKKMILTK